MKQKMVFFSLFLILFLDGFGQSLIFPILTRALILNHDGLVSTLSASGRETLYGFIVGIFFLCWMIGAAILGDLSDAKGRKQGLLICILGMLIGNLLTAIAFWLSHIWLIILGRMVIGFTAGSQAIAQAAIFDLSGEENQVRNTGFVLLAVTLGAILGPLYGQLFSDSSFYFLFQDQTPFLGVALLSLMSMAILWLFYQDTQPSNPQRVHVLRVLRIFKEAWSQKNIRILLLASLGFFGSWSIYYFYMSIYLVTVLNAQSWVVGTYMSMYGLGASIGMAILPSFLENRLSVQQGVILGWSIVAVIFLISQWTLWLALHYLFAIIAGMGVGIGFLFTIKAFSSQVSADKQGWIMGIFSATWVGIMGLSIFITGSIAQIDKTIPFILGAVLYGMGLLVFVCMKKYKTTTAGLQSSRGEE
jgi:MFS family permease